MNKTKIAVDVFNKLALEYQDKFMNVDSYAGSLDLFCENLRSEDASVLELACGPGNVTKYLLGKKPHLKIDASDLAPNMLQLARINNPQAEFELMDCRDIYKLNKKYSGVMCGFCLPYLSKEEAIKLIGDVSKILNPAGIFYLSTMEDDYAKSGFKKGSQGDEIYMHYHKADYLIDALEKNNFEIIDLRRQSYNEPGGNVLVDLIVIARIMEH